MEGDAIWNLKWTSDISKSCYQTFRKCLDNFMKIFLDDFIVYNDMDNHL
jgi:hypothetical protein